MVRFMPDRYFIDTMGCQMNERDSETIAGVLENLGFVASETPEGARAVVLNTCAVREKPEHKVFSRLGELRLLKEQRPDMLIVVAGCLAQVLHDEIARRAPYVDLIIGPRSIASLAGALQQRNDHLRTIADDAEIVPEGLAFRRSEGVGAFVNISYGCNNFCSYCIVPYARGREQSRDPRQILGEVTDAVRAGYREVALLGQNVNSYSGRVREEDSGLVTGADGKVDFPAMLTAVSGVEGLLRVRFTTSHPKDLSPRLIQAMAELPQVCEHLQLPIQAGDDYVLARMGRGYTVAHYKELVAAARAAIPGLALTTDVMVGFPGETEEQFQHTMDVFEELRYDQAFMFKYSDRPGTRASERPDKVPEDAKQSRLLRLVDLQNEVSRDINQAQAGETMEILVEGRDERSPEKWRGRTRGNKIVIAQGPLDRDLTGSLVQVATDEGFLWGFTGRIVG
jgi:tRNA-2-methylthio-N6-dimethylallyladenosine synthase